MPKFVVMKPDTTVPGEVSVRTYSTVKSMMLGELLSLSDVDWTAFEDVVLPQVLHLQKQKKELKNHETTMVPTLHAPHGGPLPKGGQ